MKRANLKAFALIVFSSLLAMTSPSFAKDSTSNPFNAPGTLPDSPPTPVQTPNFNFGQPFLLEEGDSDPFASSQTPIPLDDYMESLQCYPEGQGQPPQNGAAGGDTNAYCVVRATGILPTTTTYGSPGLQLCPNEFSPYFTVEPIASDSNTGTSDNFACPAYTGTYAGHNVCPDCWDTPIYDPGFTPSGHFFIYVVVSAGIMYDAHGNQTLAPGNAFHWKIFCVPNTNPVYVDAFSNVDVSCYAKNELATKPPILWDSGNTSVSANSSPGTITTTNKHLCPPSYSPYAHISMSAPDTYTGTTPTNFNVLNSFAACLSQIQQVGNSYKLTYLFSSSYTAIQKTPTSLTINDPTVNSNTMPALNVEWTLYCYPPDNAPHALPWDYVNNPGGPGNACQVGTSPY